MRSAIALLLAFLALGCELPRAKTSLVVVVVVDQLRPDYLTRFDGEFTGGFRRLLDGARIYDDATYTHAITATGCGHATISTGTDPALHGYVGNGWYDLGTGESVRCSGDPHAKLLNGSGEAHSPRRLLRTAVGDWLQQASPSSQVISIADKARSAVAMGGQRPDWAIWRQGNDYVTSDYYGDAAPSWLDTWNAAHDIPLDSSGALAADESSLFSLASTVVDELKLGQDGAPDLLFLGCSVADYVGHRHGPRSEEVHAYYLALDRQLGAFLQKLDAELGEGRYRLVLSSDHGVAELPEDLAAEGVDAKRVTSTEFAAQLDSVGVEIARLASVATPLFAERSFFGVVYGDSLRAKMTPELARAIAERLGGLESVAAVYARDGSIGDDEYAPFFRANFHRTRGYDLYLRHREFWLVGIGESGTNHGSAYEYDRHVPILLFGEGIAAGRESGAVHVTQIAPTIARWLHVPAPSDLPGLPFTS